MSMLFPAKLNGKAIPQEVIRNKGNECLPANQGSCVIPDGTSIP